MPSSLEMLSRLYRQVSALPLWVRIILCLVLLAATLALDWQAHPQLTVSAPYVISVLAATIAVGSGFGLIIASIAVLCQNFLFDYSEVPFQIKLANTALRFFGYGIVIWLAGLLQHSLATAQEAARHDFLTRLFNRRAFHELARLELDRSRRSGKPISVIYLDCDDFKSVNDRYGHAEGDRVLMAIADTMRATLRSTDISARLGGDEFAAILPETGESSARAAAGNLHEAVARALSAIQLQCTCSLGVAVFAAPPETVDELIHRADELMYAVKTSGKGSAKVDVFFGH